jgi:hypothetical protein
LTDGFSALSWGRERPLDLQTDVSNRSAPRITKPCGFRTRIFSIARKIRNAIVNAIHKVGENLEELRGLDHEAIRNQKLGSADRES